MVHAKFILKNLAVVVFVASMISLTSSMPQLNNQAAASKLASNLLSPTINIQEPLITATAYPGNSKPFSICVSVSEISTSTQSAEDIPGLKSSNFKVETLSYPSNGAAVTIEDVTLMRRPESVYLISLIPASDSGKQSNWVEGTYTLQLDYLKDGNQLATRKFDLSLSQSEMDADYWKRLGDGLKSQVRLDEALIAYDKSIQINPSSGEVWCDIGSVSRSLGDTSNSDRAFSRAKQLGMNCD